MMFDISLFIRFFSKINVCSFLVIFWQKSPFSDLCAASHRPTLKMEVVIYFLFVYILFCLFSSCLFISFPFLSFPFLSFLFLSFPFFSFHFSDISKARFYTIQAIDFHTVQVVIFVR